MGDNEETSAPRKLFWDRWGIEDALRFLILETRQNFKHHDFISPLLSLGETPNFRSTKVNSDLDCLGYVLLECSKDDTKNYYIDGDTEIFSTEGDQRADLPWHCFHRMSNGNLIAVEKKKNYGKDTLTVYCETKEMMNNWAESTNGISEFDYTFEARMFTVKSLTCLVLDFLLKGKDFNLKIDKLDITKQENVLANIRFLDYKSQYVKTTQSGFCKLCQKLVRCPPFLAMPKDIDVTCSLFLSECIGSRFTKPHLFMLLKHNTTTIDELKRKLGAVTEKFTNMEKQLKAKETANLIDINLYEKTIMELRQKEKQSAETFRKKTEDFEMKLKEAQQRAEDLREELERKMQSYGKKTKHPTIVIKDDGRKIQTVKLEESERKNKTEQIDDVNGSAKNAETNDSIGKRRIEDQLTTTRIAKPHEDHFTQFKPATVDVTKFCVVCGKPINNVTNFEKYTQLAVITQRIPNGKRTGRGHLLKNNYRKQLVDHRTLLGCNLWCIYTYPYPKLTEWTTEKYVFYKISTVCKINDTSLSLENVVRRDLVKLILDARIKKVLNEFQTLTHSKHRNLWSGTHKSDAISKISGQGGQLLSKKVLTDFLKGCTAYIIKVHKKLTAYLSDGLFDLRVVINFTKQKFINDFNIAMSTFDEYERFCLNLDIMLKHDPSSSSHDKKQKSVRKQKSMVKDPTNGNVIIDVDSSSSSTEDLTKCKSVFDSQQPHKEKHEAKNKVILISSHEKVKVKVKEVGWSQEFTFPLQLQEQDMNDITERFKVYSYSAFKEGKHAKSSSSPEAIQRSVKIWEKDCEVLDTNAFLNDSLIDLWSLWISRDILRMDDSSVYFHGAHFWYLLSNNIPNSFSENRNIEWFTKTLIFIPMCESFHWSLCVLVTPGSIMNKSKASSMLYFDSQPGHHVELKIQTKLLEWLNNLWGTFKRNKSKPFTSSSYPMYTPTGTHSFDF